MEFIAYRLRIHAKSIGVTLRREPDILNRDSKFAHLLLKTLSIHPGPLRSTRNVAASRAQRADEKIAFPIADELFLGLAKSHRRFAIVTGRRRMIRRVRVRGRRACVIAFRLGSGEQIFGGNLGGWR